MDPQEREIQKQISNAIAHQLKKQEAKVLQDMAQYRVNHRRMAEKARKARAAGLTYGYYVALVVEKRGRLSF